MRKGASFRLAAYCDHMKGVSLSGKNGQ
jgi:hypothetical protein